MTQQLSQPVQEILDVLRLGEAAIFDGTGDVKDFRKALSEVTPKIAKTQVSPDDARLIRRMALYMFDIDLHVRGDCLTLMSAFPE